MFADQESFTPPPTASRSVSLTLAEVILMLLSVLALVAPIVLRLMRRMARLVSPL
jgi:hypothetical protein